MTGVINDFEKIGRIAAERKVPLLLDAAQALPHVKINMKAQNISYLAGAGHKGLHGPQGTGFLALNKMSDINPLIYGGTGTNSDSVYQPHNLPESLEAGTLNAAGIVGLCESVKWTIKNADKINAKISSKTGSLVFIEPQVNIELNNELELHIDEQRKEIHIISILYLRFKLFINVTYTCRNA